MPKYYKITFWNHTEDDIEINFYGYKSYPEAWNDYDEKKALFEKMLSEGDYADGSVYEMSAEDCHRLGYGRFK